MNNRGILHKVMLVVILAAGFGLALVLPQLKKQADVRHARLAAQTAAQMAVLQQNFYEETGAYAPGFAQLKAQTSCRETHRDGTPLLVCENYEIEFLPSLAQMRARSLKYPQWFTAEADGRVSCGYAEGSLAGEAICSRVNL